MKKILVILSLIFIAFYSNAQYKEASLQASGLTCAMCSNAIQKSLEALPFVGEVDTDLQTSTYHIKFKKDQQVSFDALREAVENAGFSVAKLSVKAEFNQVKIEADTHITLDGQTLHFVNVKSQTLNGEKEFRLLDKKFTSDKEHKKYAAYTNMSCYKTGVMESCCAGKADIAGGARVYHITL
ncbi:MAG TPA: heavy metal-associated domain-containing protein [Parasegetibacter sp.]